MKNSAVRLGPSTQGVENADGNYMVDLPGRPALIEVEVFSETGRVGVGIDALHPAVEELVQAEG